MVSRKRRKLSTHKAPCLSKSADAAGDKYWSADATNIYVTFKTAPPAGTNNVVLSWRAEV